MGKSNSIEINGRRYDAQTGELLDGPTTDASATAVLATAPRSAAAYHNRLSAKPAKPRTTRPVQSAPTSQTGAKTKARTTVPLARVHEAVKARPQKRRQQRSTTLMRSAVARPSQRLKRHAKVQGPTDTLADNPSARLQRKASVHQINEKRLQRASQTTKSQAISRFSRPHGLTSEPPAHLPSHQPKPAEFPASHLPSPAPPPMPVRAHRAAVELNDLMEQALQQAVSHLEAAPVARKRRLFWRFSD